MAGKKLKAQKRKKRLWKKIYKKKFDMGDECDEFWRTKLKNFKIEFFPTKQNLQRMKNCLSLTTIILSSLVAQIFAQGRLECLDWNNQTNACNAGIRYSQTESFFQPLIGI